MGSQITATVQVSPGKDESFAPFAFDMNVMGESRGQMLALVAAEAARKAQEAEICAGLTGATGEA